MCFTAPLQHRNTVHVSKAQVENDYIRRFGVNDMERSLSSLHMVHHITLGLQGFSQCAGERAIILDQ